MAEVVVIWVEHECGIYIASPSVDILLEEIQRIFEENGRGQLKGPDPSQWSTEARAARGAVLIEVTPPGPDPARRELATFLAVALVIFIVFLLVLFLHGAPR